MGFFFTKMRQKSVRETTVIRQEECRRIARGVSEVWWQDGWAQTIGAQVRARENFVP